MNELDKILESLDKKVKSRLEKILENLTEEQRLALIKDPKLIKELLKDFDPDALAKYYQNYLRLQSVDIIGQVFLDFTKERMAAQTEKVVSFVNTLVDLKTETLRDFIQSNKSQFQEKLMELIMNRTDKSLIKTYFAETPFKSYQVGTLINTAESNIRRATVRAAYEDMPETRFRYIGGLIPTSSKTCTWLMDNQKTEGYTMKEIDAGIKTDTGLVDWWGRIPNYNCIHNWEPITSNN